MCGFTFTVFLSAFQLLPTAPYRILELMPMLASLYEQGVDRGLLMVVGNNIGYFGPYEHIWRGFGDDLLHWTGCSAGHTVLALDAVDAGVGDTVLIVQEGWSASTTATGKAGAAIDSAIVGVIDRIDLLEEV